METVFIDWLFLTGVTPRSVPAISLDGAAAVLLASLLVTAAARWGWRIVELENHTPAMRTGVAVTSLALAIGVLGLPPASVMIVLALGATVAVLALFDWRHAWLPDPVVVGLAGAGITASLLGAAVGALPWSAVCAALMNGALWYGAAHWLTGVQRGALAGPGQHAFASAAALGPGDAKLIGALAVWLGPQQMALSLGLTGAALMVLAAVRLGPKLVTGHGTGAASASTAQGPSPRRYNGPDFGRGYVPLCPLLALAFWGVWLQAAGWQLL